MNDEVKQRTISDILSQTDLIEKARLIKRAVESSQILPSEIAKALQVKKSYISSMLRIPKIPELIIDGYYGKLITLTHLFLIGRLTTEKDMIELYELILKRNLTTHDTDDEVRMKKYHIGNTKEAIDTVDRGAIESFFQTIDPSAKVKVVQTRIQASVHVEIKGDMKKTYKALKKLAALYKAPEGEIIEI